MINDDQFGNLRWDNGTWEGKATFLHLRTFGKALDERDPPDPTPPAPTETGPSKRQIEAKSQLQEMAAQTGGQEAEMLKLLMGFAERMQASPAASADPLAAEVDEEPSEEELEFRQGTCMLIIDMAGKRAKPTKAQRAAWQRFLARGETFWDELLKEAMKVYQRQRAMRVKLWKRSYGNHLLDRRLPEAETSAAMKKLLRLGAVRIKPAAGKNARTADISLHVITTWDCDGFGVIVRDGMIAEIGPVLSLVHTPWSLRETINHPVFGTLQRIPDEDPFEVIDQWKMPTERGKSGFDGVKRGGPWPWEGRMRFDPMLEFSYSADERAKYMRDRARADRPESRMAWEFADGEFNLRVYAGRDKEPSAAQAEAFNAFRAGTDKFANKMIRTIFNQYLEAFEARRANYKDRFVEDVIPKITKPADMHSLFQLRHIHVHEGKTAANVTIALQFVSSFDSDGFTAIWRNGKIAEWGIWDDARPKS